MGKPPRNKYVARRPEQQRALSSAIRLEILGAFTQTGGMSIADVAARMGRRPGSLYYHFRLLEEAGLLLRVGERPGEKRPEALFAPVATRIELPAEQQSTQSMATALKTMASAFRMAEKDLEAGLQSSSTRVTGAHRNLFAFRAHMRVTRATLAEINTHLRALEQLLAREGRRRTLPADADQYCSLTLALLPLRGRGPESSSSSSSSSNSLSSDKT